MLHSKLVPCSCCYARSTRYRGFFSGTRCLLLRHGYFPTKSSQDRMRARRLLCPDARQIPDESELPFVLSRRRFPVGPSVAMTINKAQGQTPGRVAMLLRRAMFSHGQLYVAVLRATSPRNLPCMVDWGRHSDAEWNMNDQHLPCRLQGGVHRSGPGKLRGGNGVPSGRDMTRITAVRDEICVTGRRPNARDTGGGGWRSPRGQTSGDTR